MHNDSNQGVVLTGAEIESRGEGDKVQFSLVNLLIVAWLIKIKEKKDKREKKKKRECDSVFNAACVRTLSRIVLNVRQTVQ